MFSDEIVSKYEELKNTEDEDSFTITSKIGESELVFSGESHRHDRWGKDQYAVDATVDLNQYTEDTDLETVDSYLSEVKKAVNESIGYRGPVLLRSSEDERVLSWSRRLILNTEEQ